MQTPMKKWLLLIMAIYTILSLRTACGCMPPADLRKILFTPGSVKFKIIYKNAPGH